jgi:hypothetical protein
MFRKPTTKISPLKTSMAVKAIALKNASDVAMLTKNSEDLK